MGPTVLCPGSHRHALDYWEKKWQLSTKIPPECFLATYPSGTVYFYSSHLFHAGSAHTLGDGRYIFILTWSLPHLRGRTLPWGMTYIMHEDDVGQWCVKRFLDPTHVCKNMWYAFDITVAEITHAIVSVYERCESERKYMIRWLCMFSVLVLIILETCLSFFGSVQFLRKQCCGKKKRKKRKQIKQKSLKYSSENAKKRRRKEVHKKMLKAD